MTSPGSPRTKPATDASTSPALHLRGVVLPEGEQRDLWVADGLLVDGPVAGADTVVTEGWILPGLVDAHCHIGLDHHGAVPREVQEQQALTDRDAGTLLVRDAGSAADTRWIDDREDLPKILRAGRHIARSKRYIRNYAVEIEPDELVDAVDVQARRGDGWVKLVGDWIDRDAGDLTPLWPVEALRPAIARAHELGARVTAHVFSTEALPDLLAAGIDCLEHGPGLTPELIDEMALRQVALVPTRVQMGSFEEYARAGEERFPVYAARMRRLSERVDDTLRQAYEAGVPIYAGTDAGGALAHGILAQEVAAMTGFGMAPADAVAAASWNARTWLGQPDRLEPGVPADLVVLPADPRQDVTALAHPVAVVLRGRLVAGQVARRASGS
ncbi:MAG: amidohydrolase family protein [Actinomycetales bacterium]